MIIKKYINRHKKGDKKGKKDTGGGKDIQGHGMEPDIFNSPR